MEPIGIIEQEVAQGVTVMTVEGDLDVSTAPTLGEHLTDRGAEGDRLVVLDLRQVTFMDSSALGALVAALKGFLKVGTTFRLVFDQPTMKRLFEITDLDEVFATYSTLDEALGVE
jgi:anti-sigma B factor antagonist